MLFDNHLVHILVYDKFPFRLQILSASQMPAQKPEGEQRRVRMEAVIRAIRSRPLLTDAGAAGEAPQVRDRCTCQHPTTMALRSCAIGACVNDLQAGRASSLGALPAGIGPDHQPVV